MRSGKTYQRVVLLAGSMCLASASAGIVTDINSADAVVVAQSSGGTTGSTGITFHLAIQTVFKGPVAGGTIEVLLQRPKGGMAFSVPPVCGIFLLSQEGQRWRVMPQATPQASFEDLYFPSDLCSGATSAALESGVPVAERVLAEYIRSVRGVAASPRYIVRLFSGVSPSQSQAVASACLDLSSSGNPDLRLLGLGWRIAGGDGGAVEQVLGDLDAATQHGLGVIVAVVVGAYSSGDPVGARSLGALLEGPHGREFERPISVALRRIPHRRDPPLPGRTPRQHRRVRALASVRWAQLISPWRSRAERRESGRRVRQGVESPIPKGP